MPYPSRDGSTLTIEIDHVLYCGVPSACGGPHKPNNSGTTPHNVDGHNKSAPSCGTVAGSGVWGGEVNARVRMTGGVGGDQAKGESDGIFAGQRIGAKVVSDAAAKEVVQTTWMSGSNTKSQRLTKRMQIHASRSAPSTAYLLIVPYPSSWMRVLVFCFRVSCKPRCCAL